jgi:hypothetical protein
MQMGGKEYRCTDVRVNRKREKEDQDRSGDRGLINMNLQVKGTSGQGTDTRESVHKEGEWTREFVNLEECQHASDQGQVEE